MEINEQLRNEVETYAQSDPQDRRSLRECAVDLAEATRRWNQRARNAAGLLRSGNRAEAWFHAEFPPPGTEENAEWIFGDAAQKIRAEAAAHGFAADAPDDALRRELADGFAPYREREPLLEEYRRSFRSGTVSERLFLLRKLRRLSPDDSGLLRDQTELENLRLAEISAEARRAIENKAFDVLGDFDAELAAPTWLTPPNEAMRGKIRRTLDEEADRVKTEELRDYLKQAQNARLIGNLAEATDALFQIRLRAPERLPLTAMERFQLDELEHHVSREQNRIAVEHEFNELTSNLRQLLDDQAPDDRIGALLQQLQLLDHPLPDELAQRIRAWNECREENAERRKRLLRIIAAIVLVLVAVGGWLGFQTLRENRAQYRLNAEFERALAAEDPLAAEAALSGLADSASAVRRLDELKTSVKRRLERRKALAAEVRAAITAEKLPPDNATEPLVEMAMLDRTQEERDETADLKRQLETALARAYRAAERGFLELRETYQADTLEFDRLLSAGKIDEAREILNRQRLVLARINQLKLHNSPELVEEQRQMRKKFAAAEERCSAERDRKLERGKALQSLLYTFAPEKLAAEWEKFRRDNPDAPETAQLQNLETELALAREFDAFRSWFETARLTGRTPGDTGKLNPYARDITELTKLRQLRDGAAENLKNALTELEKRAENVKVLLIRNPATGEELELTGGQLTYSTYGSDQASRAQLEVELPEQPAVLLNYRFDRQEKRDADQLEVTIGTETFSGEFLHPRRDIRSRGEHPLAIFARNLRLRLADQAPATLETFLLDQLAAAGSDPTLSFTDRAALRKLIVAALAEAAWPENAELQQFLATLPAPVDTTQPGMVRGRETMPDPLPECRKMVERNLFLIQLASDETDALPIAAGGSLRDSDNAAPRFYALNDQLPEGTLLVFAPDGTPVEVGVYRGTAAEWNEDAAQYLKRKNLVFLLPFPAGRTTSVAEIKTRAAQLGIDNIRWPHARPLNRR